MGLFFWEVQHTTSVIVLAKYTCMQLGKDALINLTLKSFPWQTPANGMTAKYCTITAVW